MVQFFSAALAVCAGTSLGHIITDIAHTALYITVSFDTISTSTCSRRAPDSPVWLPQSSSECSQELKISTYCGTWLSQLHVKACNVQIVVEIWCTACSLLKGNLCVERGRLFSCLKVAHKLVQCAHSMHMCWVATLNCGRVSSYYLICPTTSFVHIIWSNHYCPHILSK